MFCPVRELPFAFPIKNLFVVVKHARIVQYPSTIVLTTYVPMHTRL